ncbi:MAG TPA: hypothetical protein VJV04_00325 [Nitrospiraceae bacterium]|nr:hypothetical protein [Nitrospiraceae bacterium]
MAWGPNPNREEELEKLAAVREYFHEHFPKAEIRDSYDHERLAQVFRIEMDHVGGFRDAVLLTQFLDAYPEGKIGKVLAGWRVAEQLRAAKGAEVTVSSWGVEEREY